MRSTSSSNCACIPLPLQGRGGFNQHHGKSSTAQTATKGQVGIRQCAYPHPALAEYVSISTSGCSARFRHDSFSYSSAGSNIPGNRQLVNSASRGRITTITAVTGRRLNAAAAARRVSVPGPHRAQATSYAAPQFRQLSSSSKSGRLTTVCWTTLRFCSPVPSANSSLVPPKKSTD